MKKVLIISYYWPPSGGGGVQRWVKFVKYLRSFGWEPIVYVPENPEYPLLDMSLQNDLPEDIKVLKKRIWEPYRWYRLISGTKKGQENLGVISDGKKEGLFTRFGKWVRGNLFFPDARCFWIRPSVSYLKTVLEEEKIDALVSTGPPHSMHMIGMALKEQTGIPWLADFRDPWSQMDDMDTLKMSEEMRKKIALWENKILQKADRVVSVSPVVAKMYEKISSRNIDVITNGFDREDFHLQTDDKSSIFVIGHYGLFSGDRNPDLLWKIVADLLKENHFQRGLKIQLIGSVDAKVFAALKEYGLETYTEHISYLSHSDVLNHMLKASLLLLPINQNKSGEGRIPGKIFEYLAVNKPILGFGIPEGASGQILLESGHGTMCAYNDASSIKENLLACEENHFEIRDSKIEKYDRKVLTERLAGILDQMV